MSISNWILYWNNYRVNHGKQFFFLSFWTLIQLGYVAYSFYYYTTSPDYATVRSMLGPSVIISRSAANLINLNSALVLIPICRSFMTWLRSTFLNHFIPFDANIQFHILSAISILFWSFVHVMGHYFNFYKLQTLSGKSLFSFAFLSGPGITGIFYF